MSQQRPTFPPHLPRGAVAASALTLPKNSGTTVLRASPAIQIPAAPSVPSVTVPITGMPNALVRNPVISAIRPGNASTTRAPSPAVGLPDPTRGNLIVQAGPRGALAQPLQITLTQRLNPATPAVGVVNSGAAPLVGMPTTVQVAAPGLLAQPRVPGVTQTPAGTLAGLGLGSHLQQQAVLAASKTGGVQVRTGVTGMGLSSSPASLPNAAVVAQASPSVPVAKITPQRQQLPLTSALSTPVAVQTISSVSGFTTGADIGTVTSQTAGGQVLPSQTQRSQTGGVVTTTTGVTGILPTGGASLASQLGDRSLASALFNLATGSGAGVQDQENNNLWLQQLLYQQACGQLASANAASPSPLLRPPTPNTVFVPRPGAEQTKMSSQMGSVAATPSHPAQSSVLFSGRMVVEGGLRAHAPHLPLSSAAATATAASLNTLVTGSGVGGQAGVVKTGSGVSQTVQTQEASSTTMSINAQRLPLPSSSTSLHTAANLPSSNTTVSIHSSTPSLSTLTSHATIASSLIAMATSQQAQTLSSFGSSAGGAPNVSGSNSNSASPRPSILRKRTVDGNAVIPRKPNFNLPGEGHSPRPDSTTVSNISSSKTPATNAVIPRKPNFNLPGEGHSPRPDSTTVSNISSPKTPATENSQSSTDTALSCNDAITPHHSTPHDNNINTEPVDPNLENGCSVSSSAVSNIEVSPRKRARKQLFEVSNRNVNEVKGNTSSDDEGSDSKPLMIDMKKGRPLDHLEEYIDEEGVRWTKKPNKPNMSIMTDYSVHWKPKYNHFLRQTDVKPKEERHRTVNEMISQRGILQKASGWKLYHVSSQLEEVIENEESIESRMERLKERLASIITRTPPHSPFYTHYNKLLELTRGNVQRCQVVRQQMQEARTNLLNLLRHEPKIRDIITKNLAKRAIKKKERS